MGSQTRRPGGAGDLLPDLLGEGCREVRQPSYKLLERYTRVGVEVVRVV